jgi:hypothetical protein
MNYDHGTSYGYDQIQTSPLMDNYDSAYSQAPRKIRSPQHAADASMSRDMKPARNNASYYRPRAPMRKRVPLDSQSIGRPSIDETFCSMRRMLATLQKPPANSVDINTNGMMTIFIFVLILIVVINSVHLKQLTKQVDILACKNRAMFSKLAYRNQDKK